MKDLYLIYINMVGKDYKDNYIYEFIFSDTIKNIDGDERIGALSGTVNRNGKIKIGDLISTKKLNFKKAKVTSHEIESKGYDPKKGKILIDKNNKIIDGHHRTFLIKTYHGPEYKILVNKVSVSKFIFDLFFYLSFIVVVPIRVLVMFKKIFFCDCFLNKDNKWT